jgi:hypothetical protein
MAASVADGLNSAMNARDIEAFVDCFDEDYESEQPVHPDRAFRGRGQVRANWSAIFDGVPDFRAELVASAVSGERRRRVERVALAGHAVGRRAA